MERATTTLFMLQSVDGKISTGANDTLDADKDFAIIKGVKEGLHQYYELEAETDLYSLNTGRVMAKIGINEKTDYKDKSVVSFVLIDNKPHLNEHGIDYLCHWLKNLIIVTTNIEHPAYKLQDTYDNLHILSYETFKPETLLTDLKEKYGVERLTVQSGGTMNALFIRNHMIDYVDLVVAPLIVGGKDTATLVDGESLQSEDELSKLDALQLISVEQLENSYIHLRYKVLK